MRRSKSGFTVVELLTVIIVIAILASILIFTYTGIQARSRDSRRTSDVQNIVKALELYYSDNNQYPNPGASGSPAGNGWYTSGDASWNAFSTSLTTIDKLPLDPTNSSTPSTSTGNAYAYYTGTGCGRTAGQWYLIVYRFEVNTQTSFTDGTCSDNFGNSYYTTNGASIYRSIR